MNKVNILLIGTGSMSISYASVLQKMKLDFHVVGRGEGSAESFENATGIRPYVGGIENYIKSVGIQSNSKIIIATGTEALMSILLSLIKTGTHQILVEKPAAISIEELLSNKEALNLYAGAIYVAYNRRFYSSVTESRRIIEEDGGLESIFFEFTEWSHLIEPLVKAEGVKDNWFFANSTHVVDLAFHLAGVPREWSCFTKEGTISWHNKSSFSGAGITENDVIFSYLANWQSPGRWSIELLTKKRRLFLAPLEGISIQNIGSTLKYEHIFDNTLDIDFKPGLYNQLNAFLGQSDKDLVSIKNHIYNSENIYKKIIT